MADKKMMVVALAQGFYGHLREPGDQFEITVHEDDENEGRAKWYREVDKKGDVVLTKEEKKDPALAPIVPSAPFAPPVQTYKVKHVATGNFMVTDADGTQVGEVFKKVPGNQGAAKLAAQAEADRMNKVDPTLGSPISPQQAAQVQTKTALDDEPELNVVEDDDGHPDA